MEIIVTTGRNWLHENLKEAIRGRLPAARITWARTVQEARAILPVGVDGNVVVIIDSHTPVSNTTEEFSEGVTTADLIAQATQTGAWVVVTYDAESDLDDLDGHTGSTQHEAYDTEGIVASLVENRRH